MGSKHFAKVAALLLGATLAGCGGNASSAIPRLATSSIVSNGVNATLTMQSSWSGGYCAGVTLVNTSTAPVTSWSAVVTLADSTLTQVWGGSSSVRGSEVTVTPLDWNGGIAPGASVDFGICASGAGASPGATLTSLQVTGGSSTSTSYTLSVQVSGNGSTSPAAGTSTYPAGAVVQVTATPATGYNFTGWSGAATGTTNPVSVTMNGNKTLTATFSPASSTGYLLSVTKSGTGTGTVTSSTGGISCGATCSATVASGTAVTLTATAASGSTFGGWGGACTGTATCVVTMTAARSVTAAFTASTPSSTVSINAGGSATGSFVADAYYSGGNTYSTTSAIDTSGITGTVPPAAVFQTERYGEFTYTIPNLTPGSAQTVTLYFQESYWTAAGQRTFNVAINGTTVLTAFDIYAAAGARYKAIARSFSATANSSGQVVIQFTKGGGPDNPKVCGLTVAGGGVDPNPTSYTLTVNKLGTGSGTVAGGTISCGSTCAATYATGTSVTLSASAAVGSTFAGWSGACSGTAATCAVSMTAAQTVTATFSAVNPSNYVVAMVQSSRSQATDLTTSDVAALVSSAVSQAGGLDFIRDGQTVVLKPNLLTAYTDGGSKPADLTVNGISTDWRVTKAVADLVRARNPTGKILVMEGSVLRTSRAYSMLGYTSANFGSSVDEFIAIEGSSCADRTTGALEQRTALSGKRYWVNSRYVNADVLISLPTMKTHVSAGITGAVKNLGIGATPVGQFSAGTNGSDDCTRGQTSAYIDHSGPEPLGQFIRDYFSIRPADFVVMDALQGLEHGPLPVWDSSGSYDYAASRKNMRLVLAGKNAVAVDTIASLVMMCDPTKVPHLTKLAADGLGTTDATKITVVGKQVAEVAKAFAGKQTAICPGTTQTTATLAIGVSGNGTTSPAPGTYSYTSGTAVRVTATAASGATFLGWSGAATGTTNPATVTVSGSMSLTARFSGGATRPGSACQAGVSYPAPVLSGTPSLVYKPSGTAGSGTFEGPAWLSANSTLLFSDISFTGSVNPSQLLRATPAGAVTTVLSDAGVNGIAVDGAGAIFAASHKVQGIVRFNATSGTLTTVVDNVGGKKFNSPNDLVLRSDGTIYFTDPDFQLGNRTSQTGTKGVYRVSPSGTVSLVDGSFAEPNGIALSPDETVLYVADYNGNAIRAFTVAADGSTSGRRNFATVSSPDGLAMDCLGNLYVASGSSGTVQVYSPSGAQLGSISVASGVSNAAFGGTSGRTLYITAGKALYSLELNLPGYFD